VFLSIVEDHISQTPVSEIMFVIFCKRLQILVSNRSIAVPSSISHLGFPQNPLFVVNYFSSSSFVGPQDAKKHNFTVSYLVNSCGLPLERAKHASHRLHFETSERPDLVLNLLKNHGFTNAQISKVVNADPELLLSDPEKTIFPKLEFLGSIGLSHSECAKIISNCPSLLSRSLKNHIMPLYDFLKSVLLMNEKVVKTFKIARWGLSQDVQKNLAPNLTLLREIGVPQSSISLFLSYYPSTAFIKHTKFDELVEEVKNLGFDPIKSVFVHAIHVLASHRKVNWEHKIEVYQRWGWSKDETLFAFKKHPGCMTIAEENITKTMDFLVNRMGWPSEYVSRNPIVLLFSLEKRIIPRCSVFQILLSKALIKKDLALCTILQPKDKYFLENYVTKFQQNIPQLLEVYQGKSDLSDLGIGS
jgi:mTERF domain-containing protein